MTFRSIAIAAIAVSCILDFAHAAPKETLSSNRLGTIVPPVEASLSVYRQYAKAQADSLVGMTRVLAGEVKDGNLDAAQQAYAPAHRYLKRIEPIIRATNDLDKRMDARADAYEKMEADPEFSGFHRIEYGLFANRSTKDLSDYADRLDKDARDLRERLAFLDMTPAALVDGAIGNLHDLADKTLTGQEERYSRTDLWDFEANIEGARQVVALLQPQLQAQNPEWIASTTIYFAKIDELIEKHKVGCGFKTYDELSRDDKMALKAPVVALAEAFSTLRVARAMD